MKSLLLSLLVFAGLIAPCTVLAVTVGLAFDPVTGAAGYKIERNDVVCTESGWGNAQETETEVDAKGRITYNYTDAPEDHLILFRAMAWAGTGATLKEAIRLYSGAWYDHRMIPLSTPGGAGIR